jgi:hypothetical protein
MRPIYAHSNDHVTATEVIANTLPAAPGVAAIPAVQMDLLQDYDQLTLPQLQIQVMAYQVAMDRHAQNDYQLYLALTNLVDKDTKGMQCDISEFMTGAAGYISSSMLHFKKLLMKAEVGSRAMASHIRDNLQSLDVYMQSMANSNISDFIDYICHLQPSVLVEKPLTAC